MCGRRVRAITSVCRSPGSRTCSRSRAPAAPLCCATCRWRSSSTHWIADCIEHMREKGLEHIEARPESMDKWVAEVNEAAHRTVLPMAKHSWYLGANIPGKPRVFMPYAGGMVRYREICAEVAERGYEGFALS